MEKDNAPAGVPFGFADLASKLETVADLLTKINDREAAREIDRLRDRATSGEFTPEDLQDATTAAGTLVLAAAAPGTVMQKKPGRLYAGIVNAGVNDVYLTFRAPAVASRGFLLQPGGTFTFGRLTDFDYRGPVYAISTLGSTLVFIES